MKNNQIRRITLTRDRKDVDKWRLTVGFTDKSKQVQTWDESCVVDAFEGRIEIKEGKVL